MAKIKGLLNPKNASEGTGGSKFGFQEGNVEVLESVFRVHKANVREGTPERDAVVALVWKVKRLDDELAPLVHESGDLEGQEITEEIVFGLGGKSLASCHPATASGPDDEEVEDAGIEVGTEGQTINVTKDGWFPHKASAIIHLTNSLKNAGFREEIVDRLWAPDYVGMKAFMKSVPDTSKDAPRSSYTNKAGEKVEQPISYKEVEKLHVAGYEKKAAKVTAIDSKKAATNDAGPIAAKVLNALSEKFDGQTLTRKAFNQRVLTELAAQKIDPKLHTPVLALVKDDSYLSQNASKFDITFDAENNAVTFGTAVAA